MSQFSVRLFGRSNTLGSDTTFYVMSSSILSSQPGIPLPASHLSQIDLRGWTCVIHGTATQQHVHPNHQYRQHLMTRMRGLIRTHLSIYRRRLLRAYESLAIDPVPLLPLPSSCVLCWKVVDVLYGELLCSMTDDRISINEQRGNKNIWLHFPQPTCNRVSTITKINFFAPFLLPCPCPPVCHSICCRW